MTPTPEEVDYIFSVVCLKPMSLVNIDPLRPLRGIALSDSSIWSRYVTDCEGKIEKFCAWLHEQGRPDLVSVAEAAAIDEALFHLKEPL